MDEQKKLELAKTNYATLCRALDSIDWHYSKNEEELGITCNVSSEDLPVEIVLWIDKDRSLAMLLSKVRFAVREDRRVDMAIAVSTLNDRLVHGCFDYSLKDGSLFFRLANSYIDSVLGEELFIYMVACASHTVDEYNDKLMMLGKGMITLEQYFKLLEQD